MPDSLDRAESPESAESRLVRACGLAELARIGSLLVRLEGRQIVLFHGPKGVFACTNRCPHEGYPLAQGTLSEGHVLTCNWHNWKFDLASGETLVGGDRLRRYPVVLRDDTVWLDLAEPPAEARRAQAMAALEEAFREHDSGRIARELARLQSAGGDPLMALCAAIVWSHDRLEFGTTHAYAAAADWLALRETHAHTEAERLVPLVEAIGHIAYDSLREPHYPYPEGRAEFTPEALVAAIEAEDEAAAIAQARGALGAGLGFAGLEPALARAALAHYQDFGHAAIYLYKTGQLVQRLGPAVEEPLVLALVRSLVTATREDLIPEFRFYGEALAAWDGHGRAVVEAEDFAGLPVRRAVELAASASGDPAVLYHALLGVNAWNLLHFDLALQARSDGPVGDNVGWLDFTHGITFANAVRNLCSRYPALWPAGLLQMACFAGRNAGYLKRDLDESVWQVAEPQGYLDGLLAGLFDHGEPEYIVACHKLKLISAVQEELAAAPEAPWRETLLAGLRRFLESPLKRRHALRSATQALEFVAAER